MTVTPGVALPEPLPGAPVSKTRHSAVYVGSMGYLPNVDAVTYFALEIWPRIRLSYPSATFTIVGKASPAVKRLERIMGIEVVGEVPDVRPYIDRSEVSVVPLRAGSGIRMKVLEAMVLGSAIVSTSIGCEGLTLTDGKELLIADHAEAFASAVVSLFESAEDRSRLGESARLAATERFGWNRTMVQLEAGWAAATDSFAATHA
ncbi:MAG: glycosyltransferase [Candidatus Dormibacteria bacterium]